MSAILASSTITTMDVFTGRAQERRDSLVAKLASHRVWQIVLIVAVAVVLIAGIVAYAIVATQCINAGYDRVAWHGPNGWKVWEYKIICERM